MRLRSGAPVSALVLCASLWTHNGHAALPDDQATQPHDQLTEIVVTAEKISDQKHLDNVVIPQFIHSHAAVAVKTGQIARWQSSICPKTTGLDPPVNAFVSRRVAAMAEDLGVRVERIGECDPNVSIIFTTEPQKQLDWVSQHPFALLGFHYASQTKRIGTFSGTIRAWYVTATRGANGTESIDSEFGGMAGGRAGSRLTSGLSSVFRYVLVIADTSKVVDYTIGSVSDYITMLVFSQAASLDACDELPSILDLLSSSCQRTKPDALTAGDMAYLKGLYSADLELVLTLERSSIHNEMLRALAAR
jgi:hypothetical protein